MALDGAIDDDGEGAVLREDGGEAVAVLDAVLDDGDSSGDGGERLYPTGCAGGVIGLGGDEDPIDGAGEDVVGEVGGCNVNIALRCADDELTERTSCAERDLVAAG
jgi:hypothetical protein